MSFVDPVDLEILSLLNADARQTVAKLARRVTLSPTATKRRVERMEATGLIRGYSLRLDYDKLGWGISAFVELTFPGTTTPDEMNRVSSALPEVSAVYTTAGSQDVIALVRARSVDHLRDVIHRLRAAGKITSTRTHLILDAQVNESWLPPA